MGASPKAAKRSVGALLGPWLPFYGWLVLAVCTLVKCSKLQGQSNVMAYNVPHLLEDFDLSHSELSIFFSMATIAAGIVQPRLGRVVDRFGARVCIPVSQMCLFLGLSFFSLMQKTSRQLLYSQVWLGFFLLRAICMGTSETFSNACIQQWFSRRRGRAMGCAATVHQLWTAVSSPVFSAMVESAGWRATLRLGAVVNLALAPICLLLIRSNPADCGLEPDGDRAMDEEDGQEPSSPTSQTSSAATSPSASDDMAPLPAEIWPLMFWTFLYSVFFGGTDFYMIEMLAEAQGPDGNVRAAEHVFAPHALVSGVVNLGVGEFMDCYGRGQPAIVPKLMTLCAVGCAVCTVVLVHASTPMIAVQMSILRGVINGIFVNLVQSGLAYIQLGVPPSRVGHVLGMGMRSVLVGTGVGPLCFGLWMDVHGSFRWSLIASGVPHLVLGAYFARQAVQLSSKEPQKPKPKGAGVAARAASRSGQKRYRKVGKEQRLGMASVDVEQEFGSTLASPDAEQGAGLETIQAAEPKGAGSALGEAPQAPRLPSSACRGADRAQATPADGAEEDRTT